MRPEGALYGGVRNIRLPLQGKFPFFCDPGLKAWANLASRCAAIYVNLWFDIDSAAKMSKHQDAALAASGCGPDCAHFNVCR